MNNSGDRGHPCRTPQFTGFYAEFSFLILCLLDRASPWSLSKERPTSFLNLLTLGYFYIICVLILSSFFRFHYTRKFLKLYFCPTQQTFFNNQQVLWVFLYLIPCVSQSKSLMQNNHWHRICPCDHLLLTKYVPVMSF